MNGYQMPTTAREALALAWELSDPMKEGCEVPIGTECIAKVRDGEFMVYRSEKPFDGVSRPGWAEARTLDPLPDPQPDWLDAPAILASHPVCADTEQIGIWIPSDKEGMWEWPVQQGEFMAHWSELEDVTPLYPKEAEQDEWCRAENCTWRHWQSGSAPTHKRGADCPKGQEA